MIASLSITEAIERICNTSELTMKVGGKSMITYPTTAKYKNSHMRMAIGGFNLNKSIDCLRLINPTIINQNHLTSVTHPRPTAAPLPPIQPQTQQHSTV